MKKFSFKTILQKILSPMSIESCKMEFGVMTYRSKLSLKSMVGLSKSTLHLLNH